MSDSCKKMTSWVKYSNATCGCSLSRSGSSGDEWLWGGGSPAVWVGESELIPLRFLSQERAGLGSGGPVTRSQTQENGKMWDWFLEGSGQGGQGQVINIALCSR